MRKAEKGVVVFAVLVLVVILGTLSSVVLVHFNQSTALSTDRLVQQRLYDASLSIKTLSKANIIDCKANQDVSSFLDQTGMKLVLTCLVDEKQKNFELTATMNSATKPILVRTNWVALGHP